MLDHGVVYSMSRSGNVWDNAAMESFFSSLKTERTARKTYRTRNEQPCDRRTAERGYELSSSDPYGHCLVPLHRDKNITLQDGGLWPSSAAAIGGTSVAITVRWRGRV
jgi:transposase InsO family protein